MAGNIIPAIATTNAVIAGLIVMQAVNLLADDVAAARNVFLRADPSRPLGIVAPQKPDPTCAVCRDVYIPFKVDTGKCTVGMFVREVVKGWLLKCLGAPVTSANGNANGDIDRDSMAETSHANGHGDAEDEGFDAEDVEWTVYESARILADPDFDDNYEKTLAELDIVRGKMLTLRDEDDNLRAVHFCIAEP